MSIQKFEDLIAWQKSQDLAVLVYQTFKTLKDFGFRDQLRRAAVSISNNIAEGFERSSKADFSRFLYFALGSCSEVKSMLYLAEKLEYTTPTLVRSLIKKAVEISKIITGIIKALQQKN